MSHSGEDMLLLGHAFTERCPGPWAGESPESQPAGRQLGGEPDPRSEESAARQIAVKLAGDVALEETDNVSLGASLLDLALEVGGGVWVMRDANHHDAPQRTVGLAVPTTIEAVSVALARRGRDRGDSAQMGPGGF